MRRRGLRRVPRQPLPAVAAPHCLPSGRWLSASQMPSVPRRWLVLSCLAQAGFAVTAPWSRSQGTGGHWEFRRRRGLSREPSARGAGWRLLRTPASPVDRTRLLCLSVILWDINYILGPLTSNEAGPGKLNLDSLLLRDAIFFFLNRAFLYTDVR